VLDQKSKSYLVSELDSAVMELRQLQYLVAVVEEASFTRAADRVHVAQPGVSAQVRRLERELGQELLDRSGRTVRTTAAGDVVLPYARAALAAVEGVRSAVDELAGLVRGRATVGTVVGCGAVGLPELLAAFHRAHPGVEIALTEGGSDRLLAGLLDGHLDLGLIGLAGPPDSGVEVQVVVDERVVIGVPADDPWPGTPAVTLAELGGRAVVSLPVGTGLRAALDGACAAAGVTPRIAFESSDLGVVADLATRGMGVAMLPASVATGHPGLRGVPIEPETRSQLALAWRTGGPSSPAGRALVAHARAALPALA
jgi:DNA-binding transcriptional LysR family regulator